MNEKHGLSEDDFGAKGSIVKAFDAFPKSKPEYVTRTPGGGKWTVVMIFFSIIFAWTELVHWWTGYETHNFAVEKGVAHQMQINLDIVVRMPCSDLHVNVQDASGDRILAGSRLQRDRTSWSQWVDAKGMHRLGRDNEGRVNTGEGWKTLVHDDGFGEEHVHDIVKAGKRLAKWAKTPRVKGKADSCRLYGSLDVNKVQGDFHITARGHGYVEFGDSKHLEHDAFDFSHIISELSYGPFYPSLVNPLDRTVNNVRDNFHKFQYYLSVVPTVYTHGSTTIPTNQYAVTEQSKQIDERSIPGIFFKYDIEPIMLVVNETRLSFLSFIIRVVNVVSGVLVAGHWGFTITEWARDVIGRRRRSSGGDGVLGAKQED
ncbi:endoplasmic reticulum-Golgi intermediate compartment protein 2 [Geosmithia morbida]|uniref:Endoplasmic reticulum-Golgi intermediate compartment protein n=1 Tax=Geosmithia morbida TaxID=1094350 RepID=A0A9P5CY79_9HYPO|nr:endoplasmic reticulum-Golgi intermediate compartment protein 2 [Geosmithia morbida]KAF4120093.1 endoplasmic reticulum-Golgi intermediate compartment protein 2 [Geosmithia morbida]